MEWSIYIYVFIYIYNSRLAGYSTFVSIHKSQIGCLFRCVVLCCVVLCVVCAWSGLAWLYLLALTLTSTTLRYLRYVEDPHPPNYVTDCRALR